MILFPKYCPDCNLWGASNVNILKNIVFYAMLLAITIVSAVDVYYTLETRQIISQTEENPIAKWIISSHRVNMFLTIKMFNTELVQWILMASYHQLIKQRFFIWTTAIGVCVFQVLLLARIMSWFPFSIFDFST